MLVVSRSPLAAGCLITAVVLAGCGGSSLCSRWYARERVDTSRAIKLALKQTGHSQGLAPNAHLTRAERSHAIVDYDIFIGTDLHSRQWRAAANCPPPP